MPDQLDRIILILEIDYLRTSQDNHSRVWDPMANAADDAKFVATQAWYDEQIAEREAKLGLKP